MIAEMVASRKKKNYYVIAVALFVAFLCFKLPWMINPRCVIGLP